MKRVRERRSCSGQASRLRHLGAVADELKATHERLQAERAQLVVQQHLLSCLTDVLGQYRSALHEDDCGDMSQATLEQVLLEQLEQLQLLQLPGHPTAVSNCCSTSTDSSDSSSDPADAVTATSCNDISSICRGGLPQASPHALRSSCSVPPCCSRFSTAKCMLYSSGNKHNSSMQQVPEQQPVCPDNDPFMLLQAIYSQPHHPHAQDISLPQLQAKWAADVQQLAICLQKLETAPEPSYNAPAVIAPAESCSGPAGEIFATAATAAAAVAATPAAAAQWDGDSACCSSSSRQPSTSHQHPLECIKEIQFWMFGMMKSLSDMGREKLVFELQLTNWVTGECSLEPCMQRHAAVVQALELSPQQQQRLLAGWHMFQGLLNPVVTERRQLHQQGLQVLGRQHSHAASQDAAAAAAPAAAAVGQGAIPAPTSSTGSCFKHATAAEHPAVVTSVSAAHSDHGAQLQHQREQLSRLHKLARKDTLLRGAMAAYMQGCLSWAQQAKLRVLMSPYHVNAGFFFVALSEVMQQRQQQARPL